MLEVGPTAAAAAARAGPVETAAAAAIAVVEEAVVVALLLPVALMTTMLLLLLSTCKAAVTLADLVENFCKVSFVPVSKIVKFAKDGFTTTNQKNVEKVTST